MDSSTPDDLGQFLPNWLRIPRLWQGYPARLQLQTSVSCIAIAQMISKRWSSFSLGSRGNYRGKMPYTKGPACSACPSSHPYCLDSLCSSAQQCRGKNCSKTTLRSSRTSIKSISRDTVKHGCEDMLEILKTCPHDRAPLYDDLCLSSMTNHDLYSNLQSARWLDRNVETVTSMPRNALAVANKDSRAEIVTVSDGSLAFFRLQSISYYNSLFTEECKDDPDSGCYYRAKQGQCAKDSPTYRNMMEKCKASCKVCREWDKEWGWWWFELIFSFLLKIHEQSLTFMHSLHLWTVRMPAVKPRIL